jgi:hypothetical protein
MTFGHDHHPTSTAFLPNIAPGQSSPLFKVWMWHGPSLLAFICLQKKEASYALDCYRPGNLLAGQRRIRSALFSTPRQARCPSKRRKDVVDAQARSLMKSTRVARSDVYLLLLWPYTRGICLEPLSGLQPSWELATRQLMINYLFGD